MITTSLFVLAAWLVVTFADSGSRLKNDPFLQHDQVGLWYARFTAVFSLAMLTVVAQLIMAVNS